MACMEHACRVCGWSTFDNSPRTCCPDHPGESSHFFDEPMDSDEYRDDEPEEDDDREEA